MQSYGESLILLVGNKVDFGPEELSAQRAGIIEAFELLAGKLREDYFSPITTPTQFGCYKGRNAGCEWNSIITGYPRSGF